MLDKGKICEEKTLGFFVKQGYQLIAKNHQLAGVEIDLILKNEKGYLLVEVKSDNSWRMEYPISSIQKKRLFTAFSYFCEQHEEPTQIKLAIVDKQKNIHTFDLEF